jgi:hypothetical protein
MKYWWVRVPAILLFFVLTAQFPFAASCFENCQNSCRDLSGHVNDGCVTNCNNAYCNTRPSQPHPYGSIAIELVHRYVGISWGKSTQSEADKAAMASCINAGGKSCNVIFQYHNACAALAFGKGVPRYGTATESTEAKAKAAATAECQRLNNGAYCLAEFSACSP